MDIDLSIVIVTWNIDSLIAKCLSSILASSIQFVTAEQTVIVPSDLPSTEIIVVDSCSTDNTVSVLRGFPGIHLIVLQQNVGFGKGTNIGLAQARGRFLLLLNPDTEIIGDTLPTLVNFLVQNPAIGATGPHTLSGFGTTQPTRYHFPTLPIALHKIWDPMLVGQKSLHDFYYVVGTPDRGIVPVDWIQGSALLVRREVYEQIGGLDETYFMYCEDVDWCKQIKSAGWQIVYNGAGQIIHYDGKSAEKMPLARQGIYWLSMVTYFRKHHGLFAAEVIRLAALIYYLYNLLRSISQIKPRWNPLYVQSIIVLLQGRNI
jgi:N-acetylglucosaminyl-diphospho-decaprenol L-rhamnosyltransferase